MEACTAYGTCRVNVDGLMSDWFTMGSGVMQGCRIAPDFYDFLRPTDHMMVKVKHGRIQGTEASTGWEIWHILTEHKTLFNMDNTIFSLTRGLMLQQGGGLKPEQGVKTLLPNLNQ